MREGPQSSEGSVVQETRTRSFDAPQHGSFEWEVSGSRAATVPVHNDCREGREGGGVRGRGPCHLPLTFFRVKVEEVDGTFGVVDGRLILPQWPHCPNRSSGEPRTEETPSGDEITSRLIVLFVTKSVDDEHISVP